MIVKIRDIFISSKILFAFSLSYLILSFLTFTFITANVKYLSYVSYIVCFWGLIIIIFSLFQKKQWKLNLINILVALFIVSFAISSLLMIKYGITENIKGLIWLSLELLVLFLFNKDNINSKHLKNFVICFIVISTFYSLLSIIMAIIGYTHYPSSLPGDTVPGGLSFGRLYGLYSDPNYGAITSVLCILSLFFLLYKQKDKLYFAISIIIFVIQIIYISLSGSRSGLIALIASLMVVSVLWIILIKKKNIIIAIVLSLASGFICIGLCFVVGPIFENIEPQILKSLNGPIGNPINTYTVQFADKIRKECGLVNPYLTDNGTGNSSDTVIEYKNGEVNSEHVGVLGRNDNQDISNNRFSIWKSSIELFLQSPIFGLSNRNFSTYAQENIPDTYLSQVKWTSLHNTFIDVLISQGLIGLIICCSIFLLIFISLIKEIIKNKNDSRYIVTLGWFIALMIMCLFYSELLYVNTIGSVFFWYVFGHLPSDKIRLIKRKK